MQAEKYLKIKSRISKSASESGQATVEYILLLSLIIVLTVGFFSAIRKGLDEGVLVMGSELQKNIKTGRAPASVFSDN